MILIIYDHHLVANIIFYAFNNAKALSFLKKKFYTKHALCNKPY